jgi:4-diphosphocytidyl-2-C-methyl-D-erythritol kinase
MIVFPNAKINFGLNIISKRADGFHNIESLFVPININDALEFIQTDAITEFTSSGLIIPGNSSDNLILKAFNLLQRQYNLPNLKIHLHKKIPMGAGLGGGSADAAFLITALNKYFKLNISIAEMELLASQIGSDCAFFINNKPAIATSRGEILKPITIDLSGYKICIVHPGIHVNTAWAYAEIIPNQSRISVSEIINSPIENWKNNLINDFEKPVFAAHPTIKNIKDYFYENGAIYSSMSGSGSAVYGIFKNEIPNLSFNQNYSIFNSSF